MGEKPVEAAMRELQEEAGLTGKQWKLLGTHHFDYPDRILHFLLFSCRVDGKSLRTESDYTWASIQQLSEYSMPEANAKLIDMLTTEVS